LGGLYADMVQAALRNIEETFAMFRRRFESRGRGDLEFSAASIRLGVGVNNSNARNFTYLASTGMKRNFMQFPGRDPRRSMILLGPMQTMC
jgi:hypothetical protein